MLAQSFTTSTETSYRLRNSPSPKTTPSRTRISQAVPSIHYYYSLTNPEPFQQELHTVIKTLILELVALQ